jgi:hypothetical protein
MPSKLFASGPGNKEKIARKLVHDRSRLFMSLTLPRFHGHVYTEERDEIGGTNDHEDPTTLHGRI